MGNAVQLEDVNILGITALASQLGQDIMRAVQDVDGVDRMTTASFNSLLATLLRLQQEQQLTDKPLCAHVSFMCHASRLRMPSSFQQCPPDSVQARSMACTTCRNTWQGCPPRVYATLMPTSAFVDACRNLLHRPPQEREVMLTELGNAFAAHLLAESGETLGPDDMWTGPKWGVYILCALHMLVDWTLNVGYTIAVDPKTGVRKAFTLDRGTGAPPPAHVRAAMRASCPGMARAAACRAAAGPRPAAKNLELSRASWLKQAWYARMSTRDCRGRCVQAVCSSRTGLRTCSTSSSTTSTASR
jgi:hypothetical protein